MTVAITHVYDDRAAAERVIKDLKAAGFADDQISLVERARDRERSDENDEDETVAAATGATLGGVAGAGTGLLAALGLLTIPGIGPLIAAGVLATTLAGVAAGAIAGGLIGALVDYGISEDDANVYAETVQRGGTLVSVRASESLADEAASIMKRHDPVDIRQRGAEYREQGWTAYQPAAASTKSGKESETRKARVPFSWAVRRGASFIRRSFAFEQPAGGACLGALRLLTLKHERSRF